EAYILLYAKQGIPWFSTTIEVQKPCADPGISDSSPKSVLDDIDLASNLEVEKSANCSANETTDVADRASTQFSCDTQFEVKVDEPRDVADGISGVPTNESEFHVSKSIDDDRMTDASIPPLRSINCSEEATNDCVSPIMPSRSPSPDNCHRNISGKRMP
ncbi:hypothetical protein Gotur_026771, partial [Gossypium turneri]